MRIWLDALYAFLGEVLEQSIPWIVAGSIEPRAHRNISGVRNWAHLEFDSARFARGEDHRYPLLVQ